MATSTYSLPQSERINSKKQIDRLFRGGGSKAMTAAPLRMVYMAGTRQADHLSAKAHQPMAQMMVSVPKRYFKRAVKRNYVKRQVREAYRINKHILASHLAETGDKTVSLCFIWTSDRLLPTAEVMKRMANLLTRLVEKLSATDNKNIPQ